MSNAPAVPFFRPEDVSHGTLFAIVTLIWDAVFYDQERKLFDPSLEVNSNDVFDEIMEAFERNQMVPKGICSPKNFPSKGIFPASRRIYRDSGRGALYLCADLALYYVLGDERPEEQDTPASPINPERLEGSPLREDRLRLVTLMDATTVTMSDAAFSVACLWHRSLTVNDSEGATA